jgi:4-hydroxybenzoate polyprenyltransferase
MASQSATARQQSAIKTWLQLLRAPNLLTVPGDPIAGYALAAFGAFEPAVFFAVGASLCFYAAGLLDNDLADLAEDSAERPQRPLPSGAAKPGTVAIVAAALVVAGFMFATRLDRTAIYFAVALLVGILLYNHATKKLPILGALNMGACRGLSVLLGATAVPHGDLTFRLITLGRLNPLLTSGLLVALYVAAVTHLARFETRESAPVTAKWLPAVVLLGGACFFLLEVGTASFWSTTAILAVAVVTGGDAAVRLVQNPTAPIPPVIGRLIRVLLLLQTAFCAAAGTIETTVCAAVLLILWPISRALSQRFYAS